MTDEENARAPSKGTLGEAAGIITDADEMTQDAMPEGVPAEETPKEDTPKEAAAAEETPAEKDLAGDAPKKDAPADEVSKADDHSKEEVPEKDVPNVDVIEETEEKTEREVAAPAVTHPDPEVTAQPKSEAAPAAADAEAASTPEAAPAAADTEAASTPEAAPAAADAEAAPTPEAAPAATDEAPAKADYPGSVPPPEGPQKDKTNAVMVIVIMAIIAAAIVGIVLYMRFFIPREIHVSESSLNLWVGDTAKLSYSIVPSSADNLEVAWVSSNTDVATIDEFGVVTAVSGGNCAIAVATGNGKTDVCTVTVTDPAQIQKDSLNTVREFVDTLDSSADGKNKDGKDNKIHTVEQIDDTHSFEMGSKDNDLLLIYKTTGQMEDFGVEAEYTTTVRLSPENIDTAEVIQNNTLYVYGFPISMIGSGAMDLASYQHGDQVPLTTTSATVEGLDASDALRELSDSGSMICIDKFAEFLAKEGFDFNLAQFGFKNFGSLEEAPQSGETDENSLTASEAQESWNSISEESILSMAEQGTEETAGGNAEDSAALSVEELAAQNREIPAQATVEQGEPSITPFPSCRPGFYFPTAGE